MTTTPTRAEDKQCEAALQATQQQSRAGGGVSLTKCAIALKNCWLGTHDTVMNMGVAWPDLAKAVLDAAKVPYAE